jgi:GNAT superfamily N-acetyltransferase
MITTRAATLADVPAMSRVLTASIVQLCAADHLGAPDAIAAWTANKSEAGVADMLANPGTAMFVAEDAGEVVAVGAVSREGRIGLNYVDPGARFKGVSKILLARLEAELMALGVSEARLEATETARRFYTAAGWVADGPQATGRRVNGYPMRKQLSGSASTERGA